MTMPNWLMMQSQQLLKDMDEVRLVAELIDQVEKVLKKYGTGLTDAEYINVPEWPDVVQAACIAFECIVDWAVTV